MTRTLEELLEASRGLDPVERIELAEALWDSVADNQVAWQPSAEVLTEVRRRQTESLTDPDRLVSADDMEKRLKALRSS